MSIKCLPVILILVFPAVVAAQLQIVQFKDLAEFLPRGDYETYTRWKPTGETSSMMGFATSWAQVGYVSSEDSTGGAVSVKITDMVNLPSYVSMAADVDKRTDTGYERTVLYDGFRVLEVYDSVSHMGKLQAPVANRFLVEISGTGIGSTRTLFGLLEKTNLAGLAVLGHPKK